MNSLAQNIQQLANKTIRNQIREIIQPGNLQQVFKQEVNAIISQALNQQLQVERDTLLEREPYQRKSGAVSRNGYKRSKIPGIFGLLSLRKPVVRKGTLKLPLLKALKQAGKHLSEFLALHFWLKGSSTRATAKTVNAALGTKLSHTTISKISNALEPTLKLWEKRPLPQDIVYLFVDALYLPVKRPGFTSKQALFVALGMNDKGERYFLGYMLGDRESQDSWSAFIKQLLARGLNRDILKLVISDEHKGIEAAVNDVLGIPMQLCVIHKMRNIRYRVAAPDREAFIRDFKAIFWENSLMEAKQALGKLEGLWQKSYPKAVKLTLERFDDFSRFFNEPKAFWTILRSNNLTERFNCELRRRLRPAGTMHSELEVSKLVWAVSQAQEERWGNRKIYYHQKYQNQEEVAA